MLRGSKGVVDDNRCWLAALVLDSHYFVVPVKDLKDKPQDGQAFWFPGRSVSMKTTGRAVSFFWP